MSLVLGLVSNSRDHHHDGVVINTRFVIIVLDPLSQDQ